MWECSSYFDLAIIAPKILVLFLLLVLVFMRWCSSSLNHVNEASKSSILLFLILVSYNGAFLPSIVLLLFQRVWSSSSFCFSAHAMVLLLILQSCNPKSSILFFLVLVSCGGAFPLILHCSSKEFDLPPLLGFGVHEVVFILFQSPCCYSKELHPFILSLGFMCWCSSSFNLVVASKHFVLLFFMVLVFMWS